MLLSVRGIGSGRVHKQNHDFTIDYGILALNVTFSYSYNHKLSLHFVYSWVNIWAYWLREAPFILTYKTKFSDVVGFIDIANLMIIIKGCFVAFAIYLSL